MTPISENNAAPAVNAWSAFCSNAINPLAPVSSFRVELAYVEALKVSLQQQQPGLKVDYMHFYFGIDDQVNPPQIRIFMTMQNEQTLDLVDQNNPDSSNEGIHSVDAFCPPQCPELAVFPSPFRG